MWGLSAFYQSEHVAHERALIKEQHTHTQREKGQAEIRSCRWGVNCADAKCSNLIERWKINLL